MRPQEAGTPSSICGVASLAFAPSPQGLPVSGDLPHARVCLSSDYGYASLSKEDEDYAAAASDYTDIEEEVFYLELGDENTEEGVSGRTQSWDGRREDDPPPNDEHDLTTKWNFNQLQPSAIAAVCASGKSPH